jgi:hypothetical protein
MVKYKKHIGHFGKRRWIGYESRDGMTQIGIFPARPKGKKIEYRLELTTNKKENETRVFKRQKDALNYAKKLRKVV